MSRQRPTLEQVKEFRAKAKVLVPRDAKVVVQIFSYPDEPGEEGHIKAEKLGPKALINRAVAGYKEYPQDIPENYQQVLNYVLYHYEGDGSCCQAHISTLKEYKQQVEEQERKECEYLASEIVTKYNVKPYSLKFIAAIYKYYNEVMERERHFRTDPESRMERWGCCLANGVTQGFWEDNDYSDSLEMQAQEKLDRLLKYCQKYLPLLWARWEERRRKSDTNEK